MAAVGTSLSAGCDQQSNRLQPAAAAATQPAPPAARQYHLNRAQPKLRTTKLWLGTQELDAEVALTLTEISTGMMFRTNMLENEAMLFVFGEPQPREFYMKNCVLSLSAAYIDNAGVILEIIDLHAGVEKPVPSKSDKVQYVLETKPGWFERNKVPVGTVLRTDRGTLRDTWGPRAQLR
jgi:uncharacterized membrane protein (UPF0127 family)